MYTTRNLKEINELCELTINNRPSKDNNDGMLKVWAEIESIFTETCQKIKELNVNDNIKEEVTIEIALRTLNEFWYSK